VRQIVGDYQKPRTWSSFQIQDALMREYKDDEEELLKSMSKSRIYLHGHAKVSAGKLHKPLELLVRLRNQ
jgi:hypothetical protein